MSNKATSQHNSIENYAIFISLLKDYKEKQKKENKRFQKKNSKKLKKKELAENVIRRSQEKNTTSHMYIRKLGS